MATKREYLIQKGLMDPARGKGRWPGAWHDEIKKAINAGVMFEEPDTGPKRTIRTEVKDEKGRTVVKTVRVNDVAQTADPRPDRHEGFYTFQNPDGTTFKRLHTTGCVKCGYSFQWCLCDGGPFQFAWLPPAGQSDLMATLVSSPPLPGSRVPADAAPRGRRRSA